MPGEGEEMKGKRRERRGEGQRVSFFFLAYCKGGKVKGNCKGNSFPSLISQLFLKDWAHWSYQENYGEGN